MSVIKFDILDNQDRVDVKVKKAHIEIKEKCIVVDVDYSFNLRVIKEAKNDLSEEEKLEQLIQQSLNQTGGNDYATMNANTSFKDYKIIKKSVITNCSLYSVPNFFEDERECYFVRINSNPDWMFEFRDPEIAKGLINILDDIINE